ncbi:hypothetical protein [Nonomuraea dietziae]|uniref:hypothetical protein n=1 Tax=Nonomuraea dietziae TaxID=65515 RepID=UPI00342BA37D
MEVAARLLLHLADGSTRTHGPLFLSERRPVPARRPAAAGICPHTGRARVLLEKYAGLDPHQLRHSAATPSAKPKSRRSSSWARPGTAQMVSALARTAAPAETTASGRTSVRAAQARPGRMWPAA